MHPIYSTSDEETAVALLRLSDEHPEHSQRPQASELGVSLGKTPHCLLNALLGKGWAKAPNFQRSNRKLGYLYVLTQGGIRQMLQLTQAFLARKGREYFALRSQVSALRKGLANQGGDSAMSADVPATTCFRRSTGALARRSSRAWGEAGCLHRSRLSAVASNANMSPPQP